VGPAIADAIVPVAGLGTRLLPVTRAIPKELLPVGRMPVLQHVVEELAVRTLLA
jgi:UTP--glucose-1-phosphate uridylyltransferase